MKETVKIVLKKIGIFSKIKVLRDNLKNSLPEERAQQKKMLTFYSQFIKSGDLVFDIGANIGNRVDIFLKLGATVVAVEPQPICIEQLELKYKNNPKVHIVKKGCGAEIGEHHLHLSNADTISTMADDWLESVKKTGRFQGAEWNETISVPITTLDELIREFGNPAFCKIDVEGFELEVIKGLSKEIKALSFEYARESHSDAVKIINILDEISNYNFNFSDDESMYFQNTDWLQKFDFLEYLETRKENFNFGDIYCNRVD